MKNDMTRYLLTRAGACFLLGLLMSRGYGQAEPVKRLHIGDTMPPLVWRLLNSRDSSFDLGKVHSRLTILSFWTPECSFSAGQLGTLYRLEQTFPQDVTILPVAFDGGHAGQTQRYLASHAGTPDAVQTRTALEPAPFSESGLYSWLPFVGLPQNVWLDTYHVIRAITDHLPLTEQNIRRGRDEDVFPAELKDYDFSFDGTSPLLVNNNGGADSTFSYRSLITPYNPRISLGEFRQRTESRTRIAIGNSVPLALLQEAVLGSDTTGNLPSYDPIYKRVVNRVTKNDLFGTAWYDLPEDRNEWAIALRQRQAFCYDLVLPPSFTYQQAYRKMKEDLCDFFGVTVSIESIPVTVLRMSTTSYAKPGMKDTNGEQIIISEDHLSYDFRNCRLQRVAEVLNSLLKLPVIVCGQADRVAVTLSFHLAATDDAEGLKKELATCGIRLAKKQEKLGMIVIKNR